jgi:ribonuclease HII
VQELSQLYKNEQKLHMKFKFIAGIDEAGRGPLAGPVVIAAVILNPKCPILGVNDSKKLSATAREKLYIEIIEKAVSTSIIVISHNRIDEINILQAVLEGMKKAASSLSVLPDLCLIDGNKIPDDIPTESIACIKGDANYASIAAASILAKVHRDRIMVEMDKSYPMYGFTHHKGYPTPNHIKALREHGPSPIHRLTYAPVKHLISAVNRMNKRNIVI